MECVLGGLGTVKNCGRWFCSGRSPLLAGSMMKPVANFDKRKGSGPRLSKWPLLACLGMGQAVTSKGQQNIRQLKKEHDVQIVALCDTY